MTELHPHRPAAVRPDTGSFARASLSRQTGLVMTVSGNEKSPRSPVVPARPGSWLLLGSRAVGFPGENGALLSNRVGEAVRGWRRARGTLRTCMPPLSRINKQSLRLKSCQEVESARMLPPRWTRALARSLHRVYRRHGPVALVRGPDVVGSGPLPCGQARSLLSDDGRCGRDRFRLLTWDEERPVSQMPAVNLVGRVRCLDSQVCTLRCEKAVLSSSFHVVFRGHPALTCLLLIRPPTPQRQRSPRRAPSPWDCRGRRRPPSQVSEARPGLGAGAARPSGRGPDPSPSLALLRSCCALHQAGGVFSPKPELTA